MRKDEVATHESISLHRKWLCDSKNYNLNALNGFILTVIGNLKYENFKTFKVRILGEISLSFLNFYVL